MFIPLASLTPPAVAAPGLPPGLHIPDGFLSPAVALVFWALSVGTIAVAIRQVQTRLGERYVPFLGVMAAFVFAAQMINFPVAGGTSGHLVGGALAAILLGPWAGMLVMTVVVAIQGLLFQDGGLVVMGANIFNMGVVTALIGYGIYRLAAGQSRGVRLVVAGIAAWLSVLGAALFTALQLWASGTSALGVVAPAMLGVHLFIGLGEALITVGVLGFVMRTRPELMSAEAVQARGGRGWIVAGLAAALAVVLLSPFASANPDGLERVARDLGFGGGGGSASRRALLAGYELPGLGSGGLSTVAAGVVGVLVVTAAAIAVGRLGSRTGTACSDKPE